MKTVKFQSFDSCGACQVCDKQHNTKLYQDTETRELDYHQQLNRIAKESMF